MFNLAQIEEVYGLLSFSDYRRKDKTFLPNVGISSKVLNNRKYDFLVTFHCPTSQLLWV